MFPLLLLAAAGAAIAAYGFSPTVHSYIDEHAKAVRDAFAHHSDADAKLASAQTAVDVHAAQVAAPAPTVGPAPSSPPPAAFDPVALARHAYESLKSALASNAASAAHMLQALTTAKTPEQKTTAVQGAAAVSGQQAKIAAALAKLGSGECDAHTYPGVTPAIKEAILAKLASAGMVITGDEPWDIDTNNHGVRLRAVWDPAAAVLTLIVVHKDAFVPCMLIWPEVDAAINGVIHAA